MGRVPSLLMVDRDLFLYQPFGALHVSRRDDLVDAMLPSPNDRRSVGAMRAAEALAVEEGIGHPAVVKSCVVIFRPGTNGRRVLDPLRQIEEFLPTLEDVVGVDPQIEVKVGV